MYFLNQQRPGIYLVLDPSVDEKVLLQKLKQALKGGIGMLQVWNHWPAEYTGGEKQNLIRNIVREASGYNVPVLINEEAGLIEMEELSGIHFDAIPANLEEVKSKANRKIITGITCGNNLDTVRWAEENDVDYISFCSMFPSPSAGECEIVKPETVQQAREITKKPVFLSGGITLENLGGLKELDFEGVAVISGILNAEHPGESVREYDQILKQI